MPLYQEQETMTKFINRLVMVIQDCGYNTIVNTTIVNIFNTICQYEHTKCPTSSDRPTWPRLYCYVLHELKRIGFCLLLKTSAWLLHPIGDKVPPAARNSSEVARTLNWRY